MDYHTLKETIYLFFFPLPLCAGLLAIGTALILAKRRTIGRAFFALGFILLLLITTYPLPQWMLKGLEGRYPVFGAGSLASYPGIRYVVVLSGGLCRGDVPITSMLDYTSVVRLNDGVILFRELKKTNPEARLIVTGKDESAYLARLSEDLGVNKDDILIENWSNTTYDQARLVSRMTKGDRIFLVTSASHMPRAVALFKKAGTDPVPVPANFIAREAGGLYWQIVPRSENVKKAETAVYEYLGMVKERLAGNI